LRNFLFSNFDAGLLSIKRSSIAAYRTVRKAVMMSRNVFFEYFGTGVSFTTRVACRGSAEIP